MKNGLLEKRGTPDIGSGEQRGAKALLLLPQATFAPAPAAWMDIRASGARSSTLEAAMTKVFAVAVSFLTISLGTVALSFKTIDVEAGPLSVNGTAAQSINDRGDVVGFTMDETFLAHP